MPLLNYENLDIQNKSSMLKLLAYTKRCAFFIIIDFWVIDLSSICGFCVFVTYFMFSIWLVCISAFSLSDKYANRKRRKDTFEEISHGAYVLCKFFYLVFLLWIHTEPSILLLNLVIWMKCRDYAFGMGVGPVCVSGSWTTSIHSWPSRWCSVIYVCHGLLINSLFLT